ncbi:MULTISPECIES: PEP-utilizing enzyme [unclassified Pseudomonas]|uniref:PEP-utilizing enzyme n=1 Tax=unclassified Pseudomonas TaxID=196821 RepID=UPI000BD1DB7A|nr:MULTISPECIES: PEP/pyruvate-binding domain-containing protein [unclassified Pseudomonas]PVZ16438.1 pyruvate phosphate dikinase-like enzyme [Pseudomonas sp. URIL14HWK12:I12]PVZ25706.1 pyruvate phosphate dikinase-like enzyme [Pseudomonas sp. URIL14HWK12:I10]PVZ36770.1 pyruvate phosphate dikinase-like enzyme [Pseudomonas sp. URIL14HWK12:I11]SNZ12648.1 Phosphoenolpyruvate synthase/pyruvate phosphate dikinase [Pseudomonas sp. URIL14HWK12:I9]
MSDTLIAFGTKAETLERLRPWLKRSIILPQLAFSTTQWRESPAPLLASAAHLAGDGALIVRSSARGEDGAAQSMAGAFSSCLNVPTRELPSAIEQVIESFAEHPGEGHQVLIQPMLSGIQMSGVVMTHDLEHGAPYYVLNYDDESGKTDTITGGTGIHKTVLIYRDAPAQQVHSPRVRAVLDACRELEPLCGGVPLDIEFAVDHQQQVYVLQVRRITLSNTWHPVTERRVARQLEHVRRFLAERLAPQPELHGHATVLGVMPDWNPAEIIGTTPRPLAASLYRFLVTDSTWREARAAMGYQAPPRQRLMVTLGHHPYIDVRCSFNSFLPAGLAPQVSQALVDAWLARLKENPEFHDKVEFDIVPTCLDFTFDQDFQARYPQVLDAGQFESYRAALDALTRNAVMAQHGPGSLPGALAQVRERERLQSASSGAANLSNIERLLQACRAHGTYPFAVLARHAFIAEALMRSACRRGALALERLQAWKQSIETVTTELARHYAEVCNGQASSDRFLQRFGHLRPGTYEITSLRYDERHDLFAAQPVAPLEEAPRPAAFALSDGETLALQALLDEHGWPLPPATLLAYASQAIQAREYAKLIFTRDLSDALKALVNWGGEVGLAREDLSFLNINEMLDMLSVPLMDDIDRMLLARATQARNSYENGLVLKLGHLIGSLDDLVVVPLHRSLPNYVTQKHVEAPAVQLQQNSSATLPLQGMIVCIENADPGYDWVFTRGIAGLVTQYGGANSHMAIRCAEFGIPAAIGCGEQLFNRLVRSRRIALDCQNRTLQPV